MARKLRLQSFSDHWPLSLAKFGGLRSGVFTRSSMPCRKKGPRGSGFKFFSECLDQQLIRATMVAEGADVLADGNGATHLELICQPAVARLGRLLEMDGKRDFPGG